MTDQAPQDVPELENLHALATRARAYLANRSVSEDTARSYARLFRDQWGTLCELQGADPLDAPASTVVALFRAARTGTMRRPGNNNQRTGPLHPGFVDSVLAAVRHTYVLADRVPPQNKLADGVLSELRGSYRAHHAVTAHPVRRRGNVVAMPLADYHALCTAPTWATRAEGCTALSALLSLEADATDVELSSLHETDVLRGPGGVTISFGGRSVRIDCHHRIVHGIVPVCLACLVGHYIDTPAVLPDGPLLATHPGSLVEENMRHTIRHRLRAVARRWPGVRCGNDPQRRLRLEYYESTESRSLVGTRQGIALVSTALGYCMLRTKTVAKLAACAGLTHADAYTHLRWGDVADGSAPADGDRTEVLRLTLRETVRSHTRHKAQVTVAAQDDPVICAATAVREWILIREAASGRSVLAGEPLFPDAVRWWLPGAGSVSGLTGRKSLRTLQARACLEPKYQLESARELYLAQLVAQGARELQIHKSLRLKKPEHTRRATSRHAHIDCNASRRVLGP